MHAVLDQIEEPVAVLRQAIREMEEELARQQQRQKWIRTEIRTTSERIEGLEQLSGELDTKLDICFANDNEALARKITRRKLETAKLAEHAEAARESLNRKLEELDAVVASNADQLECMQQKAAVLAADVSHSESAGGMPIQGIDDDDVEIALLREKQARASS
jgi:phage shock protein A